MKQSDSLSLLRVVFEKDETRIFVSHDPWTSRYQRAERRLKLILFEGKAIGFKAKESDGFELVVWNEPSNDEKYGWYSVFRVYGEAETISSAILYCFYDGLDKSSEKIKSEILARDFMKTFGFEEIE